jgi:4a-hydroxytetrahydrobiopterin dehydratase
VVAAIDTADRSPERWQRFKRTAALRPSMAQKLADEPCEACTSDDEPLTEEEYQKYLDELNEEVWTVIDDHHLEGTYPLEDFRDALDFTYGVGELAEEEWHHPDIHLQWGEVEIEMWTHKIDGLHKTDFVMAARMDRIYEDYL